MTTVLPVHSSSGTYDVVIGDNVLASCGTYLTDRNIRSDAKLFIVTDTHVAAHGYAQRVHQSVTAAGYAADMLTVQAGDGSKTLETATQLYDALLASGLRRDGVILAVGGGMVGDLAGFVAATYLRGIRFVQIPTTLLAHDSSIGGKVGVNLPQGKNLVGAFHPPLAVLYDTTPLQSLPAVEWQGGMAELIKHGMIGDVDLFAALVANPLTQCPDSVALEPVLARACSVKIRIVERDEHESDQRMVLNIGHTVGHAVEQLSRYSLNHGYGVAIGLSVEAQLATDRGWLAESTRDLIRTTLAAHGLPISPPDYDLEQVFAILGYDKKHGNQGWTFALPRAIGRADIARDVTPDEVRQAWEKTIGEGKFP